jgi:hypothetical protein
MRSTSTKFVLVSTADAVGIEAARSVAAELASRDFAISALVCNRSFIPELGTRGREATTYPARLAALVPKLERMRTLLTDEDERKRANMVALSSELGVPGWALPEASRSLAHTSALATWIERARPIEPRP